jgi:hypothetical protein
LIELDQRSSVFVTVCLWILHLVKFGRLSWFILENVPGIRKRKKGVATSFADWFLSEMSSELPDGWRVTVVEHNSMHCLLPQSRDRVFFVGTAPRLRQTALQRRVLDAAPFKHPSVDILHFLDQSSSDDDWGGLTLRQQVNVLHQLSEFRQDLSVIARVGVVDIARDPLREMDSKIQVGGTRTLRTNCSHLWILPGQLLVPTFGPRGRLLNRAEKCRISGIVPSSLASLSAAEVDTAVGNTIPVPLVGHILYPVLRAWVCSLD